MTIILTPFEVLYGALTMVAVIISVLLGILIALKYFKFRKIDFLLVGSTWIFLVSPYWSDAIQFITIMIFDIELINAVKSAVSIPVIASSGAGCVEHFFEVFTKTEAESALAAGIFHRREVPIGDVKKHLKGKVEIRL